MRVVVRESAEGTDSISVPGNDRRLVAVNLVLSHLHVTVNGTPLLSTPLHSSPLLTTLPSAVFYLPFVFRPPRYVTMSKLIFFYYVLSYSFTLLFQPDGRFILD